MAIRYFVKTSERVKEAPAYHSHLHEKESKILTSIATQQPYMESKEKKRRSVFKITIDVAL